MSPTTKDYGIIVGIDGSPASDAAVSWAAHDAAIRGLPLTLVHVENPAAPTWSQAPMLEESAGEQVAEGRSLLANASTIARDAIADTAQIQINGELLSSAIVPTLVDQSKDAELIVVGSSGRGALSRGFLGSVSSGLIRHAHCPVALIRDEDPQMPHPAEAPVLVGIDGSTSDLAAAIAFEEASRRHADLIGLHAWNDTDMSEIPGYDWSPITTKEDRLLAEALAGWQQRYPGVTVHKRLVGDRAARALVDASESAQLVVIGSHGSGALAGMLLGSVSNAVVQAVHRPVIVARPS
jgi:nucleotide-binding universal stress UspA family protein